MTTIPFDPFQDRLSRDIRNQLSRALLPCMRSGTVEPAQEVARNFLLRDPGPEQRAYIKRRLELFARFLATVGKGPTDVLWQGFLLWDLGLHFEVHEILEHAWKQADGQEKLLLQAMIRAAGVYIKAEYGYLGPARSLASKALPVLQDNRERLAAYIDPEQLFAALRAPELPPPRLLRGLDLPQEPL
ncbi:MAG: DUF309 domain-containing protein [Desulfobulbus sp.]|jgi:hypothetical protein